MQRNWQTRLPPHFNVVVRQYPTSYRLGLSDEFVADAVKRSQWQAFIAKNKLEALKLDAVIDEVCRFVSHPMRLARQKLETL